MAWVLQNEKAHGINVMPWLPPSLDCSIMTGDLSFYGQLLEPVKESRVAQTSAF
jgi:hypothetical protein